MNKIIIDKKIKKMVKENQNHHIKKKPPQPRIELGSPA